MRLPTSAPSGGPGHSRDAGYAGASRAQHGARLGRARARGHDVVDHDDEASGGSGARPRANAPATLARRPATPRPAWSATRRRCRSMRATWARPRGRSRGGRRGRARRRRRCRGRAARRPTRAPARAARRHRAAPRRTPRAGRRPMPRGHPERAGEIEPAAVLPGDDAPGDRALVTRRPRRGPGRRPRRPPAGRPGGSGRRSRARRPRPSSRRSPPGRRGRAEPPRPSARPATAPGPPGRRGRGPPGRRGRGPEPGRRTDLASPHREPTGDRPSPDTASAVDDAATPSSLWTTRAPRGRQPGNVGIVQVVDHSPPAEPPRVGLAAPWS